MITKIKMNGVASYRQPVIIDDIQQFNFFYGLNGTGKTTLSDFLQVREEDKSFEEYIKCTINPNNVKDTHEIFVYNQNYIDRIFRRNLKQPGIFSLGEKDVEAEKKIEAAEEVKGGFEQRLEPIRALIEQINNDIEKANKNIRESIWNEEQPQKNTTSLAYCLKGAIGSKKSFFNKISKTNLTQGDDEIDLEELEKEADKVYDEEFQEKTIYNTLPKELETLENSKILQQRIVGNKDSYLSELIERLNNYNWVRTGIDRYLPEANQCPFCQEKITEERKADLNELIDDTYKQKETELKKLQGKYSKLKEKISSLLDKYQEDEDLNLNPIINEKSELLKERLNGNFQLIKQKVTDPSQPVNLSSSYKLISEVNEVVILQNERNKTFNNRIADKKSYEADIKSRFWIGLRQKYNDRIRDFEAYLERKNEQLDNKEDQKKQLDIKIKEQETIIRLNRIKSSTVQKTIDYINQQLANIGFEGFFIESVDDKYFKLSRPDRSGENTFSSLSEGEKTIITFLYFIQQCLGSEDQEENPDLSRRVIVIDDPISSLSFPLIFEVATIIKELFLIKDTPFAQIFILTHHLYFYHELIGKYPKNKNNKSYYRVSKNGHTIISTMKHDEIKNAYQSYWVLLKDIKDGNASVISLPNTMRNILEHYFSFIEQNDSWKKAIEGLIDENKNDPSIKALKRYVDRESHSDLINIVDAKDFDIDKFFQYFRSIFEKTKHLKHYQKMMNEKVSASNKQTLQA